MHSAPGSLLREQPSAYCPGPKAAPRHLCARSGLCTASPKSYTAPWCRGWDGGCWSHMAWGQVPAVAHTCWVTWASLQTSLSSLTLCGKPIWDIELKGKLILMIWPGPKLSHEVLSKSVGSEGMYEGLNCLESPNFDKWSFLRQSSIYTFGVQFQISLLPWANQKGHYLIILS